MYLIAGIDPGTTTGIAILDFEGRLIDLSSSKNLGLKKAIRYLMSKGNISLIATDVSPCPDFISKIATKLGASTHTPPHSLLIQDKISLTRNYKTEDSHQRDALAAALVAFKFFQKKFHKIDALNEKEEKKEKIKHLLLHGFSIKKAQLELEKEKKEKQQEKKKKRKGRTKQKVGEFKKEEKRKREIYELKKFLIQKEKKIKNLERDIEIIKERYRIELKKEEEIQKREISIKSLKNKIKELESKLEEVNKLKEVWQKIAQKKAFPLVVFPQKGKIVLIDKKLKKKNLKDLKGVEIAFTPLEKNKKYLKDKGIVVASSKKVKQILDFFYVEAEEVKKTREKKKEFQEISLEEIVRDYRSKRERINKSF